MDIFGLTIYFPYLCKVRVTKPFITFIIIICYMIGNGITIEESVAVSIKNLIINTYFKNTIHLKRFLETNRLVTLPPFDVEDLDDKYSRITLNFKEKRIVCSIAWRHTNTKDGSGRVIASIDLI